MSPFYVWINGGSEKGIKSACKGTQIVLSQMGSLLLNTGLFFLLRCGGKMLNFGLKNLF
jgi:hypothetical protein